MTALVIGFSFSAGLIIAIGAQNAFVLRAGILHQHVFIVCMICALSDALLILLGVMGVGFLVQNSVVLLTIAKFGGAIFLFAYGLIAFYRMFYPRLMQISEQPSLKLSTTIITALTFTYLNPHVYLDTVILLGSYSAQYEGVTKLGFTTGAISASFVWFFLLGYGARLLEPIFHKAYAWQILDGLIGIIMIMLCASLLLDA